MPRNSGYHYVMGKDGRRRRVYDKPQKRVIRGKGGYYDSGFVKTMQKIVPKGTFRAIGRNVGGLYGMGGLGGKLGRAAAKIAGFGAYHVKQNSLISEGQSPAAMHSTNSRVLVRHREYIQDIQSAPTANTFTNQSIPINPGLVQSFPWLAPIASQYESYMIKGMVYEFKTLYADAIASSAANSSIGGVIMATDYNPLNGGFVNKQQMDNTEYTTSCKPSESFYHAIECAPQSMPTKQLYVRSGAVPANADLRLYDLGTFNIASFGIASTNVVLGELWCTYEIEFIKPVSLASAGLSVLSDNFSLNSTGAPTAVLGSSQTPNPNNSLGGTIAGNVYSFPPTVQSGVFLFTYYAQGGAATTLSISNPTIVNGSLVTSFWPGSASSVQGPPNGVVTASCVLSFAVQVTRQNCTVTFVASSLPATSTSGELVVTQLQANL